MHHLRINRHKISSYFCGFISLLIMSAIFFSLTNNVLYYRVESYVGIISFVVTAPLFLLYLRWKIKDVNSIAIFVLVALFTTIINPYASFGSFLSLLTSLLMMQNLSRAEMPKVLVKFHIILLVAFIIYSFYYSLIYRADWWYLSHNYIGANIWGRCACFSAILLTILSEHFLFEKKVLNIIFMVIATVAILYFKSRGSLICILFFFLLYLIPYVPKDRKMIKGVFVISFLICICVPIVAVIIGPLFSSDDIFGKSLFSGRDLIWKSIFIGFAENPIGILFGLGANKLEAGTYSGFVHNNLYGIIVNYGLFGLFIYTRMLYSIIKKKSSYIINNRANWHAYIAVITFVFILGTTEITSLWVVETWFCYLGLGLIIQKPNARYSNKGVKGI